MEAKTLESIILRMTELENRLDSIMKMNPFLSVEKLSETIENVIKKTSREEEKIRQLQELIWLQRFAVLGLIMLGFLLFWLAK